MCITKSYSVSTSLFSVPIFAISAEIVRYVAKGDEEIEIIEFLASRNIELDRLNGRLKSLGIAKIHQNSATIEVASQVNRYSHKLFHYSHRDH